MQMSSAELAQREVKFKWVFYNTLDFAGTFNSKQQTSKTVNGRRRTLWRLIWICTVCQTQLYKTLSINELAFKMRNAARSNCQLTLKCQSQQLSSALSSACDFKSHFCKQCGPISCSSRSSLIRVHTVACMQK